jgi:hypothetical protein
MQFSIFYFAALLPIVFGLVRRTERILWPSVVIALVMLGWIAPQVAVLNSDNSLSNQYHFSIVILILMSISIVWVTHFGWIKGLSTSVDIKKNDSIRTIKIFIYITTLVGLFFRLSIFFEDTEEFGATMWSGKLTIYFFFSKIQHIALIASLWAAVRYKNKFFVLMLALNLITIGGQALFLFKRELLVLIGITVIAGLIIIKGYRPSRKMMIVAVFTATLIASGAGFVRSVINERDGDGNLVDVVWSIDRFLSAGAVDKAIPIYSEVGNAVRVIEKVNDDLSFNYGSRFIEYLVFAFFPGQLFGSDFKSSLMRLGGPNIGATYDLLVIPGATFTVFSDLYEAFWLFGAIIYGLIGYVIARVYKKAVLGEFVSFLVFVVLINLIPLSITHGVVILLTRVPEQLLFIYLFIFVSRFFARIRY